MIDSYREICEHMLEQIGEWYKWFEKTSFDGSQSMTPEESKLTKKYAENIKELKRILKSHGDMTDAWDKEAQNIVDGLIIITYHEPLDCSCTKMPCKHHEERIKEKKRN